MCNSCDCKCATPGLEVGKTYINESLLAKQPWLCLLVTDQLVVMKSKTTNEEYAYKQPFRDKFTEVREPKYRWFNMYTKSPMLRSYWNTKQMGVDNKITNTAITTLGDWVGLYRIDLNSGDIVREK